MSDARAFEDAGLYDPASPGAPDRLALLEFLDSVGISIDEMIEANRIGRLASIAADRFIFPERGRYTQAEVAARSGLSPELLDRVQRASGFPTPEPDARIFTEADVEAIAGIMTTVTPLSEEVTLQLARSIGSSLARIAEAVLSAFEANVGTPLRASQASELERARAGASIGAMLPLLLRMIDVQLRHHMQAARRRRWETEISRDVDVLRLVVGFADLVGSTPWVQLQSTDGLARAIASFESISTDAIVARGGRAVKQIGDEVMFVAADPRAAAEIARALVHAFARHEALPPVRIGMALGDVVPQDGDYYGPVVNLAARAVRSAEPNEILVSASLVDALPGERCTPAGARALKGFDDAVELHRLDAEAG